MDTGFVTTVIGEACPLHLELAPGVTMTYISDCYIPSGSIDTANGNKNEYYGKVKNVIRIKSG